MSTNAFKRLVALLPSPPLLVGDVQAVGNGIASILVPGGRVMQARGAVNVGDRVFFRNSVIEGPAPDLPIEEIEV